MGELTKYVVRRHLRVGDLFGYHSSTILVNLTEPQAYYVVKVLMARNDGYVYEFTDSAREHERQGLVI